MKQRLDNEAMREQAKRQQQAEDMVLGKNDLFQQLFAERRHVSYEKRAIADKVVELMKDQMMGDGERRQQQFEKTIEKVVKD